jgi:hypothetical protein
MTDMPIACTLRPADLKARLSELAELTRSALISLQRDDLTLHLRYALEAEDRVLRMIEQEQKCCAFLTFTCRRSVTAVELQIDAPEAARESIEEIYAAFELR